MLEYDLHELWPVATHTSIVPYGVAAETVGGVLAVVGEDGALALVPLIGAVPPCASGFTDVVSHHPFCAEIDWLASGGIAGGYEDGTFRPTVPVSRQAMAAFLYRSAGSPAFRPRVLRRSRMSHSRIRSSPRSSGWPLKGSPAGSVTGRIVRRRR